MRATVSAGVGGVGLVDPPPPGFDGSVPGEPPGLGDLGGLEVPGDGLVVPGLLGDGEGLELGPPSLRPPGWTPVPSGTSWVPLR